MDVYFVCELCVIVGCVLLLRSGHVHICLCGLPDNVNWRGHVLGGYYCFCYECGDEVVVLMEIIVYAVCEVGDGVT